MIHRLALEIDARQDTEEAITKLAEKAKRLGLNAQAVHELIASVRAVLDDVVPRARHTAAIGAQFSLQHSIAGEGYEVDVRVTTTKPTVLKRLMRIVGL